MRRALRAIVEFTITFMAIILLVLAGIIWRLNSSPINSTFLTPYIESGIERFISEAHVQIAHTLLTWDNADHSFAFHADAVVVKNAENQTIAEVPSLDIRLSLLGVLVGQFWPMELTIDHPQIKLIRHANGKLYFASMTTQDTNADTGDNSRDVLKNAMYNLAHAYAMRHLNVFRAAIAIHDEKTNADWSVGIPEISLIRTFLQLEGTAKIDLTQKKEIETLELHYAYDHAKSLHRVSTRFQDITPAQLVGGHPETLGLGDASMVNVPLSGEMEVAFDPNLDVAAAAANLHGGKGVFLIPDMWDKPRSIDGFDIEGDFDRQNHKLNLQTATLNFGGAKLDLTATGHAPTDPQKYDLDFTLNAKIENWPMDAFADLWPKPMIANARDWMVHNLSKGVYEKGQGAFNGSLSWSDPGNMAVTSGQGQIVASGGTVAYIDDMPPVQDVHVDADFDLQKMTLALSNGGINDLKIEPFTATITGLSDNDQFIDIPLKVIGPVPDIIKLIDHPPLHYASVVGLAPDMLSGTAEGTVDLHFPLIKTLLTKDIDVSASAALTNIATSKLIKGLNISEGNLALGLTKDGFTIKGTAAANKIPMQIFLQQSFQPPAGQPLRQVDVTADIGNEQWNYLGDAFTGTTGSAVVTLNILESSTGKMNFTGDAGLSSADLHFNSLNWKKPRNVPADLQFKGDIIEGKGVFVRSIHLQSPQAVADGKAEMGADGVLRSLSLEPLKLGRTSANLYFTQSEGEGGELHFTAKGKSLDVAGLRGGKDPERSDPRPKEYRLNVDKLYTSDTGVIANAEGFAVRDREGWKAISLHGLADGEHQLAIELAPQNDGASHFLITCDDFGKMLKGLGFTDTVKEGDVKIEGSSTPEHPRVIVGKAKIGGFSVGKLPVLALLLNATSPFGFSGLVTDSASFEHMNGTFRWFGDQIVLKNLNAAGTSVGMNIAGKVDMNSGQANLHGTMVPFSMVNRFLGAIPLIGDLLTGGDGGGILAVAYTIKGSLSDPKVGVNPTSLLTPGFLRNLFFGSGDDDDDEDTPEETVPADTASP